MASCSFVALRGKPTAAKTSRHFAALSGKDKHAAWLRVHSWHFVVSPPPQALAALSGNALGHMYITTLSGEHEVRKSQ